MKGILTTHPGMEDIASLEVKEIIGKESIRGESCVVFDIDKYEDLFKLCYMSQSASGIYLLLCEFDFDNLFVDLEKSLEKIDLSQWLNKKNSFRVRCIKNSDISIDTPVIEKKAGEIIINRIQKNYNYKQNVSLENPDIPIFIYLTGEICYVAIDFAGFDLSIRIYKIFAEPSSIKGTLAFALVKLSDYKKDESLLDCFAYSGMIAIEAALHASKFSVNFFNKDKFAFLKMEQFNGFNFKNFFSKLDKRFNRFSLKIYSVDRSMKYVQYAKKNAKIAGIDKKITFSRFDLEWLDTKFEKSSINKIVAKLPLSSEEVVNKTYKEFFYQAEFILDKKGKIIIIANKDIAGKYAAEYGFIISKSRSISSGSRNYDVLIIEKKRLNL